ncbi:DNA-binding transcriptional response regulator, NtrC family, contains REC, AAA-type ATPase, and a Fis-type DNA-binding domains [Alteromonadaceae bacterium Bs31]|nr:DNA-binding transcriptional response regulator, NtrC family, contains REC, AAA-type ATPase, and a Fis-type DNA-binding domains [Alteromonadaceae bacterium Bs31]
MARVLVIDDNPAIGSALELMLNLHHIETETVLTPQAGLTQLAEQDFDLVIQDMNFTEDTTSGEEGMRLFHAIRDLYPDLPVILITAWTCLEAAVDLVKNGAADYIAKPWDDAKLLTSITNLLELSELQQQQRANNARLSELKSSYELCGLIFQSQAMTSLVEMAIKIAHSDVPVLITGPNGSGKEKIAELIQKNSRVAAGPFVRVNVGALPDDLMEAELFGAEAGAYTGITKQRQGRFELAHGGTLFLDEMGNLSASGQAKLLRVLQTGEFERLGSSETRKCSVRIISATNANLLHAIEAGKFREDLLYRLNVIELKLPPLADRPEDIPLLLQHFLAGSKAISHPLNKKLQQYHWPGNVRELENACKRAILLSGGRGLEFDDFGLKLNDSSRLKRVAFEPDKNMIVSALEGNQGNISQAARQLGLTRQALYRRMDKYEIKIE